MYTLQGPKRIEAYVEDFQNKNHVRSIDLKAVDVSDVSTATTTMTKSFKKDKKGATNSTTSLYSASTRNLFHTLSSSTTSCTTSKISMPEYIRLIDTIKNNKKCVKLRISKQFVHDLQLSHYQLVTFFQSLGYLHKLEKLYIFSGLWTHWNNNHNHNHNNNTSLLLSDGSNSTRSIGNSSRRRGKASRYQNNTLWKSSAGACAPQSIRTSNATAPSANTILERRKNLWSFPIIAMTLFLQKQLQGPLQQQHQRQQQQQQQDNDNDNDNDDDDEEEEKVEVDIHGKPSWTIRRKPATTTKTTPNPVLLLSFPRQKEFIFEKLQWVGTQEEYHSFLEILSQHTSLQKFQFWDSDILVTFRSSTQPNNNNEQPETRKHIRAKNQIFQSLLKTVSQIPTMESILVSPFCSTTITNTATSSSSFHLTRSTIETLFGGAGTTTNVTSIRMENIDLSSYAEGEEDDNTNHKDTPPIVYICQLLQNNKHIQQLSFHNCNIGDGPMVSTTTQPMTIQQQQPDIMLEDYDSNKQMKVLVEEDDDDNYDEEEEEEEEEKQQQEETASWEDEPRKNRNPTSRSRRVVIEAITKMIALNTSIIKLELEKNQLCCNDYLQIANALKVNTTMEHLNLKGNELVAYPFFDAQPTTKDDDTTKEPSHYHQQQLSSCYQAYLDVVKQNITIRRIELFRHSPLPYYASSPAAIATTPSTTKTTTKKQQQQKMMAKKSRPTTTATTRPTNTDTDTTTPILLINDIDYQETINRLFTENEKKRKDPIQVCNALKGQSILLKQLITTTTQDNNTRWLYPTTNDTNPQEEEEQQQDHDLDKIITAIHPTSTTTNNTVLLQNQTISSSSTDTNITTTTSSNNNANKEKLFSITPQQQQQQDFDWVYTPPLAKQKQEAQPKMLQQQQQQELKHVVESIRNNNSSDDTTTTATPTTAAATSATGEVTSQYSSMMIHDTTNTTADPQQQQESSTVVNKNLQEHFEKEKKEKWEKDTKERIQRELQEEYELKEKEWKDSLIESNQLCNEYVLKIQKMEEQKLVFEKKEMEMSSQFKEKYQSLKEEKDILGKEIESLQKRSDKLLMDREKIIKENRELKKNIESLVKEKEEQERVFKFEYDQINHKLSELKTDFEALENENDALESECNKIKNEADIEQNFEFQLLKNERDIQQKERDIMEKELHTMNAKYDALRKEKDRLSSQLTKLLDEKDALVSENGKMKKHMESIEKERDRIQQESSILQQERDSLKNERDSIISERDSVISERDSIKGERDIFSQTISNWNTQLKELVITENDHFFVTTTEEGNATGYFDDTVHVINSKEMFKEKEVESSSSSSDDDDEDDDDDEEEDENSSNDNEKNDNFQDEYDPTNNGDIDDSDSNDRNNEKDENNDGGDMANDDDDDDENKDSNNDRGMNSKDDENRNSTCEADGLIAREQEDFDALKRGEKMPIGAEMFSSSSGSLSSLSESLSSRKRSRTFIKNKDMDNITAKIETEKGGTEGMENNPAVIREEAEIVPTTALPSSRKSDDLIGVVDHDKKDIISSDQENASSPELAKENMVVNNENERDDNDSNNNGNYSDNSDSENENNHKNDTGNNTSAGFLIALEEEDDEKNDDNCDVQLQQQDVTTRDQSIKDANSEVASSSSSSNVSTPERNQEEGDVVSTSSDKESAVADNFEKESEQRNTMLVSSLEQAKKKIDGNNKEEKNDESDSNNDRFGNDNNESNSCDEGGDKNDTSTEEEEEENDDNCNVQLQQKDITNVYQSVKNANSEVAASYSQLTSPETKQKEADFASTTSDKKLTTADNCEKGSEQRNMLFLSSSQPAKKKIDGNNEHDKTDEIDGNNDSFGDGNNNDDSHDKVNDNCDAGNASTGIVMAQGALSSSSSSPETEQEETDVVSTTSDKKLTVADNFEKEPKLGSNNRESGSGLLLEEGVAYQERKVLDPVAEAQKRLETEVNLAKAVLEEEIAGRWSSKVYEEESHKQGAVDDDKWSAVHKCGLQEELSNENVMDREVLLRMVADRGQNVITEYDGNEKELGIQNDSGFFDAEQGNEVVVEGDIGKDEVDEEEIFMDSSAYEEKVITKKDADTLPNTKSDSTVEISSNIEAGEFSSTEIGEKSAEKSETNPISSEMGMDEIQAVGTGDKSSEETLTLDAVKSHIEARDAMASEKMINRDDTMATELIFEKQPVENQVIGSSEAYKEVESRSVIRRIFGRIFALFIFMMTTLTVSSAIAYHYVPFVSDFVDDTIVLVTDNICSPVAPGTSLDAETEMLVSEAPWWVPSNYKSDVFSIFCGTVRKQVRLEWTSVQKSNWVAGITKSDKKKAPKNTLVIKDMKDGSKLMEKKSILAVGVDTEQRLRIYGKRGKIEDVSDLPWKI